MAARKDTQSFIVGQYVVDFLPKVKVEVAVPDDRVEQVIEALTKATNTGTIGDGKNLRVHSCSI